MTTTIPETCQPKSATETMPILTSSLVNQDSETSSTISNTWVDRHGIWLLGLFACFLFFYRLGSYSLFDVDEPRYAEAAREMIERQSWITPYFNYALRLEKPVFFYWLEILSYQAFGISEFSARLVSALTATSLTAMSYALGRLCVSKRFGFWSAVILMTSLEFIALSRMSITDMTLACMLGGTFISLFLAVSKHPRWWIVGGIFSGFAILTKGPVGIILPGAILMAYSLLTRQFKKAFFTPYFLLAVGLAVAIASPWYYLAWKENGQFFIDSLLQNNVSRFSGAIDYHSEPFYYYGVVLLAGFLPWTPFLVPGILNSIQTWKANSPISKALSLPQQLHWYTAVWAIGVFAFFTVADTKLLTYILPMFPALALWLASAFDRADKEPDSSIAKITSQTSWVLCSILGIVGIIFSTQMGRFLPKEAAHISNNPANWIACGILLAGSIALSYFLQKRQVHKAFISIGLAFSMLAIVALQAIVPHVNNATQGKLLEYLGKVGNKPLATYEITKPSLTFYAKRRILAIKHESNDIQSERDTLEAFLKSACSSQTVVESVVKNVLYGPNTFCQPVYIITKNRFLAPLTQSLPRQSAMTIIEKDAVYSLVLLQYNVQKT